jgi:hypothetical protein
VTFLELNVRNIRRCFHWEDLTDPTKTSQAIGHPQDWVFLHLNMEDFTIRIIMLFNTRHFHEFDPNTSLGS